MSFTWSRRGLAPRIVIAFVLATVTAVADGNAWRSDRGRAPWCGNLAGDGQDDCNYYTFEQCRVSVHGLGGACARNPRVPLVDYDRPLRRPPRPPR
jgi:Protein of unknown function (DUF3551)